MFHKIYSFLIILFVVSIYLIIPKNSFAANEFSTDYDINYDVGTEGITNVTEKITLKNKTDTYFASSFSMSIGSTTLTDISAKDEGGVMEIKAENKDNQTIVNVKFNQQITGLNKDQSFTLNYKSKDFAEKIGKTWEVNLPKIHQGTDIESFKVTLSVPLSFGEPTSITPKPVSEYDKSGKLFFVFSKEQLAKSGVSVNFGTNQIFDFLLKYNLENTSFLPVVTSIVLPSDTNYQDISITNIDPKPLNVTIDADGNYLAWYQIPKRTKQQVNVQGLAKLYIIPKPSNFSDLTEDQKIALTKSDRYWEKDNPNIKAVLKEIFKNGEPKNTKEKVKLIYQYVVDTLKYDTSRLNNLERLGAVTALNNTQNAVCMEFTDLFIALTRAAGIPARELDGYAYSQNKKLRPLSLKSNLLHSWPEYFDEKSGWIMVDPTWENTSGGVDYFNKFDLNHIVLTVRGNSSVSPNSTDEIVAEISDIEFKPKQKPNVEILISNTLWAGLPSSAEIKVSNDGSEILNFAPMKINSSNIQLLDPQDIIIPKIPPYGFSEYKINLRTPFLWESKEGYISVNYMGQEYSKKISIKPIFSFLPFPYIFFSMIVLLILGYLLIFGIHYFKKNNLKIPNKSS